MKLITAIVQKEDCENLLNELVKKQYRATRIGSTGGFLRKGNITLLIGVDDGQVDDVIEMLKQNCHLRREVIATRPPFEVRVGGAVVFVQTVDRYEQV